MIKCCVFDLDGTLLSTLDTITYHLNNTLKSEGISPITVNDTRNFIGNGARKLVFRAIAKGGVTDEVLGERVLRAYNEAYNRDPLPCTEPYPGITELVDSLCEKGVRLAVVTNKPQVTAKKLIEHFFPGKFSIVSGGRDDIILKPDPTETLRVIAELCIEPSMTAFIGDTSVDIITGKNAQVALTVGVSWGFREERELIEAGADAVVKNAAELYAELVKI